MKKIISDFKDLLQEREEKLMKVNNKDIISKREIDEIQEDFFKDERRKLYHNLRIHVKGKLSEEKEFMDWQNKIFNS